jgi:hypothetical protein
MVSRSAGGCFSDGGPLLLPGDLGQAAGQVALLGAGAGSDLDEAIEVASKHPLAKHGAMELRPFGAD